MNKFALCAFADEAGDILVQQIDALKANGIAKLEIRNVDGVNVSDFDVNKAKEVKKALDDNGISVFSIGSPIGKIGIEDDFEPHLEKFKHTLQIADILGAKAFRLFSFYIDADKNPQDFTDEVLERMSRFAEVPTDVTLCHENEKGIFGDKPERCVMIHKALPKIKAVFDPANFVQCGVDTLSAFDMLSPYVQYMHIKDAVASGNVVPAGRGDGNIAQILQKYSGSVLTLEPHLFEFSGLAALENDGEKSKIGGAYKNGREAFDAGAAALKNIINK